MGKKKKDHLYIGKHTAKRQLVAAVFTSMLILMASAFVALAVIAVLEHHFPIAGGVLPSGPVLQTLGFRTTGATEAITPPTEREPTGLGALVQGLFERPAAEEEYIPAAVHTAAVYVPMYLDAFARLPFYLPENSDAYWAFYLARPDLEIEDIVWMVNVGLNRPFYTDIKINTDEVPLLVSPQFRLPAGFSPEVLVPVTGPNCPFRATPETAAAFRIMREAARKDNIRLTVVSAYRSAPHQRRIWENGGMRDGAVARPYHSEHQTGRALDLGDPAGGLLDRYAERVGLSETGLWVQENAFRFGFIVRYGRGKMPITGYIYEPWHITYVGLDIAFYMHQHEISTLEEFVGRNPWVALPPPAIR